MGHPDDDVGHPAVGGLVEELVEESHHALCPLAAVPLHRGELGGQEMVELLRFGDDVMFGLLLCNMEKILAH